MKVGAESRGKVIALVVLGVLALIAFGRMLFTMGDRQAPVSAAPMSLTTGAAPARRAAGRGPAVAVAAPSLDPELRLNLLESSEGRKYEGTGRNIFVPMDIPTPVASGLVKREPPPVYTPPPPPPINLKFFGFASNVGEPKRVFLAQGDNVFIGQEGQIVDRRYKIVRINPASVEIEDVLNNNRQTIPLSQS